MPQRFGFSFGTSRSARSRGTSRSQSVRRRRQRARFVESLEPRQVLATDLVISEFMASNSDGLTDKDGEHSDWVEIFNTTTAAVSLNNWYLTDSASSLTKWQFPNVSIPGKSFLVIFASDKNLRVAGQELHTNFKLSAGGEYLGLVRSDGVTVASEYAPTFPAQTSDVSYGGNFSSSSSTLIGTNAAVKALVPTSNTLGTSWLAPTFNDASWTSGTTGVGFDTDTTGVTSYTSLIHLDVKTAMMNINPSVYMRLPFTVADPSTVSTMTLRMKYDDGYVAYLNGTLVASKAAPTSVTYNSSATGSRDENAALVYEDVTFSIPSGLLNTGSGNVLAIQGLNYGANSSDLLMQPELIANQITWLGTTFGFFTSPTPNALNNASVPGIVGEVSIDKSHGFYTSSFTVGITTETAGATIRYTTDGSTPTSTTGTVYSTPITVSATTTLRAAAFKSGYLDGPSTTETYLFLSDIVNQSPTGAVPGTGWPASGAVNGQTMSYGIDTDIKNNALWGPQLQSALTAIPSISIVTDLANLFNASTGIYVNATQDTIAWERPTSLELINPDGSEGFQINAGIRIRGGFSRGDGNPKHAFRFFFRSDYGDGSLNYPLFGDEGASSFEKIDLRTSQNYSWSFGNDGRMTMVNDIFARDTQRDMGDAYSRGRVYHLYINGQYWGVYETDERPDSNFGATYFGGEADDYDVIKVAPDDSYTVYATDGVDIYTRNASNAITGANSASAWVQFYNLANSVASTTNATTRLNLYLQMQGLNPDYSTNASYPVLLDVQNLVDYMILTFYTGSLDGPVSAFLSNNSPNNFFAIRNRNIDARQGFRFISHDAEHTLLNPTENRLGPYSAGNSSSGGSSPAGGLTKSNPQWIHQQLMAEPSYLAAFNLRVQQIMRNNGALTTGAALARFDSRADQLRQAIIAESARWGDAQKAALDPPFTKTDWQAAVDQIEDLYMPDRTATVLSQLQGAQRLNSSGSLVAAALYDPNSPLAPGLSASSQMIAPGFSLTLTNPSGVGTIYYTLDGTDPRKLDGTLSASALTYTGPVVLNTTAHIFARVRNGTNWGAYSEGTYALDASKLRVTEIMYHPAEPAVGSPYAADDFEFIELQNTGTSALSLREVKFTSGLTYTFGATTLAPGQFAVLARNAAAFASRYPSVSIVGTFTSSLSDGGENLRLEDALGNTILDFDYKDSWYPLTDGSDFSLVTNNASAATSSWDDKENWRTSQAIYGNPGAADTGLVNNAVVINEVMTNTTAAIGDWIELANTTTSAINIGGWYLSNGSSNLMKFRIPAGTTIAAGGYLVFNARDHFNNALNPNALVPFEFSAISDAVYLTSVDDSNQYTGYRDDKDFGGAAAEISFGRQVKSTGHSDFVAMQTPTSGAANSGPLLGPIVINELQYRPTLTGDEFIELYNISGSTVTLSSGADGWQFTDGITFQFVAGTTLNAGAYALVVPIAPSTFRTKYGIPAAVQIFGPYTGALNSSGELVRLSKPGTAVSGTIPWISVDHVDYQPDAPWPTEPNLGVGRSLSRIVSASYGNDAGNWLASSSTGATPGAANVVTDTSAPVTPKNVAVAVVGMNRVAITWDPAWDVQSAIGSYRIYRNGVLLGTAPSNATRFEDPSAAIGVNYQYTVAAVNIDGFESAGSTPLNLRVAGITSFKNVDATHFTLVLSEAVTSASAQAIANYVFNNSLSVVSASLGGDQRTVTITTSAASNSVTYQLTLSGLMTTGGALFPASLLSYATILATTGGLTGQYFDQINFTAPKLTRTDATVNFDIGVNAPMSTMGTDYFSIRWTGYVVPSFSETYTFYPKADDGVRLWVNNQLLVDKLSYIGNWEWSGSIALVAGQKYELVMEYVEQEQGSSASLSWSSPSVTKAIIPSTALIPSPSVSIADVARPEGFTGIGYQELVVSMTSAVSMPVYVSYSTADSAALTWSDFNFLEGTLTFLPGETVHTINVPINGDGTNESNENFIVSLLATTLPSSDAQALGTISTDDRSFSVNNVLVTESSGAVNAVFTVAASYTVTTTTTVVYTTSSGTADASDFTPTTGTLTFTTGNLTKTVTVPITTDSLDEGDETFFVTLSNLSGANFLGISRGQGVIVDDDPTPTISIGNVSLTEGDSGSQNAVFVATLSNPSASGITVNYQSASGTATSGSDFTGVAGSVSFAPGSSTVNITVPVLGDTSFEANETFTVSLSTPVNATLGTAVGTGTILNNDPATFDVINTNDAGTGSLRDALTQAAQVSGSTVTITFHVPGLGPFVFAPVTQLPTQGSSLVIDVASGISVQIGSGTVGLGDYPALTKTGAGTLILGGNHSHAQATTLTAAGGTLELLSNAGSNASLVATTNLKLSSVQTVAAVTVPDGGSLSISAGGVRPLQTAQLALAAAGVLDLNDHELIVSATAGTRAAVQSLVTSRLATGFAGGAWNGLGIRSGSANADSSHLTALGTRTNDNGSGSPAYATFAGLTADQNAVLVKRTYYGDADLNGVVNSIDYALTDNGRNFALSGWINGDFNYSGDVNSVDLALIDNAYNFQGANLAIAVPIPLGSFAPSSGLASGSLTPLMGPLVATSLTLPVPVVVSINSSNMGTSASPLATATFSLLKNADRLAKLPVQGPIPSAVSQVFKQLGGTTRQASQTAFTALTTLDEGLLELLAKEQKRSLA